MRIIIPTYEGHTAMTPEGPGVMGSLEKAGQPGLAVAAAGEQITKLAGEVNKQLRFAEDSHNLSNLLKDSRNRLYTTMEEVQRDLTTPDTWKAKLAEESRNILAEVDKAQVSQEVKLAFKKHWAAEEPLQLHNIERFAQKQRLSNIVGDLENKIQEHADLYWKAPDDLSRARIKGTLFGWINQAVEKGALNPDRAEHARILFDKNVAVGGVMQEIQRDPVGAYERLRDPNQYQHLNPQQRGELVNKAWSDMHRRMEEKTLEVQQKFDAGTLSLDYLRQQRDAKQISVPAFRLYESLLTAKFAPGEYEKNEEFYMARHKEAMDGKLNMDLVYQGVKSKIMDRRDHDRLVLLNASQQRRETPKEKHFTQDPTLKGFYKINLEGLEEVLKPLDKMAMQSYKPGEKRLPLHIQAAYQFNELCEAAFQKGELTPQFMQQKAQELLNLYGRAGAMGAMKGGGGAAGAAGAGGGAWGTGAFGVTGPRSEPAAPAPVRQAPAEPPKPLFNPTKGPKQSQQQPW